MKNTKQLRLARETVRNLVPRDLSQVIGGGGISVLTEVQMTGTITQAKPRTNIHE